MMKKISWVFIVLAILILLIPMQVTAQDDEEELPIAENSSGNFFGIGARGLGMGGAQIAAGMDGSTLVYNPAALARIRRIEVQVGMSHQRLSNDENIYPSSFIPNPLLNGRSKSFTRLNAINVSVPAPTYRGSAVVAFGINRVMSFDQVFQLARSKPNGSEKELGTELETGGLYLYSIGGAVDLSPRISVGAALNLYHGNDNYTWSHELEGADGFNYSQCITADYTGVSAKVGLVANINPHLSLGAVVESPIGFDIDGEYSEGGWSYPNTYEYELKHPFSFGAGAAFNIKRLQLALDLSYTDWTQMEYTEYPNLVLANKLFDLYYRETLKVNAGAEYLVPFMGAKIRAGYIYDPLPYADFLIKNDREFVTFGVGFLIDRIMTLDIAYIRGTYEYTQPNTGDNDLPIKPSDAMYEKYTGNRIYVTTAFRL